MKKIIIRILTLAAIFVLAVVGFYWYLNQGTTDTTETMAEATFPLVYMKNGDSLLNCLHGYTQEMDVTAMRDTLTPLENDRTLNLRIDPYKKKISDISYEVLNADGSRTLENTKVNKTEEQDGYLNVTLSLQDNLLINTEYALKLKITAGGQVLYYYTRIINEDGLHTESYLDFAMGFYERCLNKNDLESISAYIEPSDEGDNSTFAFSDIHCSMDQLSWGSLSPQAYYKPTPSLKEINDSTATIVMDYMISAKNDNNETELYAVSEYYRMLYTEERIRLLDFERTVNEVFNPENTGVITSSGIDLGIAGRDVEYLSDLKNNCVAFVRQGALWEYQTSGNKMMEVFSFPQQTNSDARDTYMQNDIQIVNIDEAGNMYFLVSGYMNRGRHEGESDVAVYYFNATDSSITECLFVEAKQNYELLKRDVEDLNYISTDRNYFYVCVDGSVYGIDFATHQAEVLVSGLKEGCYGSSRTGRYFAWTESTYDASVLTILDLDTRQKQTISCGDSERLRYLGFLDEAAIYGIADTADINTAHAGLEFFPMKKVELVNGSGEVVKEYSVGNYYVTDTVIESKMMTMTRVERQADGSFVDALEDHIVSSSADESGQAGLTTKTTSRKETETYLTVGSALSTSSAPKVIRSRETIQEGTASVKLEASGEREELYYVYAKGKLYDVCTAINTAVKTADENLGVVVDGNLQNIWERGNKVTKLTLDTSTFPDVIRNGSMDVAAIEEGTGRKALDLSGCTLDSVLYYVSEGTPVLAKTPITDQTPQGIVIIAGYDEYNTILMNPGETETFYYGINDSTALFEEAGNVFMTYWDPISD